MVLIFAHSSDPLYAQNSIIANPARPGIFPVL